MIDREKVYLYLEISDSLHTTYIFDIGSSHHTQSLKLSGRDSELIQSFDMTVLYCQHALESTATDRATKRTLITLANP